MAILQTGNTYADNDQVTAATLNAAINSATFASGAVDGATTQLSGGAVIVRDGGVTAAKVSTGGPSWDSNGNTVIRGVNTNSNAAAGVVGEIISSIIVVASGVSLTSATPANVTSIALTAGDWDISGYVYFEAIGACRIDGGGIPAQAGIHSTSATLPGLDSGRQGEVQPISGNGYDYQVLVPVARVSLSGSATYYLVAQCTHNTSPGVTASGSIRARRVR